MSDELIVSDQVWDALHAGDPIKLQRSLDELGATLRRVSSIALASQITIRPETLEAMRRAADQR